MDLWQLHIFCKILELKSFSAAGKAVHLSQPTVSNHIKALEDHFGCRLIDRLSKQAVPTKAGEILYRYARRMIILREETEAALAKFQGKTKGHLLIGGSTIPGVYVLPKIIGKFKHMFPEVTISLVIGDTEKIIAETLAGTIELGIVGAGSGNKKLNQEKLIDDEMRLVIPADHKWESKNKILLEKVLQEPFIVRECGSGTLKSIAASLSRQGKSIDDLNIVAEMGTTEAITQGIKNKVGISILSTIAVTDDLHAGTLKSLAIEGIDLRRSFYLTTHKQRSASPLGQAFHNFLTQWFQPETESSPLEHSTS